jgi:hypothetical protein
MWRLTFMIPHFIPQEKIPVPFGQRLGGLKSWFKHCDEEQNLVLSGTEPWIGVTTLQGFMQYLKFLM